MQPLPVGSGWVEEEDFFVISLEFVSLCVNERNQLLLWDFYQDCEDLIFYRHIIAGSGNLFTREGERETRVVFRENN